LRFRKMPASPVFSEMFAAFLKSFSCRGFRLAPIRGAIGGRD